jgi:DNA replication initiation complex subunit (GINS family)
LSEMGYEDIRKAWEEEVSSEALQNLSDLRLSRMVSSLSKTRLQLAETPAENRLQADLFTQQALNMEFMLRDLLELRRQKIIRLIIQGRKPSADMTVSEQEGFYVKLKRAFEEHEEFIIASLAGSSSKIEAEATPSGAEAESQYVVVRFLRTIEDAFVGLDELVYGPFKKGDVAVVPTANVEKWGLDGTISTVAVKGEGH